VYYVANESLISAIKKLHESGAHESFRIYLTLKAHGMKYESQEYVRVGTTNVDPALQTLFAVPGLSEKKPFYNPLLNELLDKGHGRGGIQTSVKKYLDQATKTKMTWLEGYQGSPEGAEKPWYIRFSSTYPENLGSGQAGMASKDGVQITVHTPSFVLWMNRDAEFDSVPTFDKLWQDVQQKLNLHPVEVDLLFTKDREFEPGTFVDEKPDHQELVDFITKEAERGSTQVVLKAPDRPVFSPDKIRRIVSGYSSTQQEQDWLSVKDLKAEALSILEETRALLIVGPPGTGKTKLAFELANAVVGAKDTSKHLFQFHASYAYEDFIQALTPQGGSGSITFEPVLKRFALACEAAQKEKQVVILDELNRADVSKVFGEAFLLIEMDYRDEKYAIPYLYKTEDLFWIPKDLYLVGTLNDLDKSTFDIDFAFRRRFGQVTVNPSAEALEQILKRAGCTDEDFIRILLSAFNDINRDHYPLGHAYFKNVKDRESLLNAYRRTIRPTIAAFLGQYRKADLDKVDSIVKRVSDVETWEEYQELPTEE
jgi:MoxR-like ATPase